MQLVIFFIFVFWVPIRKFSSSWDPKEGSLQSKFLFPAQRVSWKVLKCEKRDKYLKRGILVVCFLKTIQENQNREKRRRTKKRWDQLNGKFFIKDYKRLCSFFYRYKEDRLHELNQSWANWISLKLTPAVKYTTQWPESQLQLLSH